MAPWMSLERIHRRIGRRVEYVEESEHRQLGQRRTHRRQKTSAPVPQDFSRRLKTPSPFLHTTEDVPPTGDPIWESKRFEAGGKSGLAFGGMLAVLATGGAGIRISVPQTGSRLKTSPEERICEPAVSGDVLEVWEDLWAVWRQAQAVLAVLAGCMADPTSPEERICEPAVSGEVLEVWEDLWAVWRGEKHSGPPRDRF
ncbi:hypothetical protein Bbelb_385220 [Branchiostoma belcheri]|nr:hypothetical protein Bbelb_385220 [Branchiostoma belcheri]